MNKTIYASILACIAASAYADEISLGYCDGSEVTGTRTEAKEVAVRFPADEFPMYWGNTIIGVRIGLGSDAAKGVDVFFRDEAGNEIFSQNSGPLYKGWNDIYFDKTTVFPDGSLTAGYQVPLSVTPGTSSLEGLETAGTCLVFDGASWTDRSLMGEAPLCIQILIDGDTHPANDVALLKAFDMKAEAGTHLEVKGYVRNNTNEILDNLRLRLDCGEMSCESQASVDYVLPGEIGLFFATFDAVDVIGTYGASLTVTEIAGKSDEYGFNDSASLNIGVVDMIVTKKVLIEEFTGQYCQNCPSGLSRLKEAMKGLDNIVMVAHHIGFGTDDLTAQQSDMLTWFYNQGDTTYAPAMMVDRIAYSESPGPVGQIGEAKNIHDVLESRLAQVSEASIQLKRNFNRESRQLRIEVQARKVSGMEIGDNPVLCVMLTENGIIGFQSPNHMDYEHNEANRLFLTHPLGDPIALCDGETETVEFDVNVDENWVADNMHIVAFVGNRDDDDCNNCRIYNSEECSLVGDDDIQSDGIRMMEGEQNGVEDIYNISGMRVTAPVRGLSIIKYKDGRTQKMLCF